MKKLISLFLVVAMLSSFAIIASAETKMTFNVQWFGTEYDDFVGEYSIKTSNRVSEAKAGDVIAAVLYVPANAYLGGVGYFVTFDTGVFELVANQSAGSVVEQAPGVLKGGVTYAPATTSLTMFGKFLFRVKADPVKSLESIFKVEIDPDNTNSYNPGGGANAFFTPEEATISYSDLTINGLTEGGSKEFAVTAVDNGANTVVTVANKGDKTGKVYVATFVGGVLDLCQVKDLADGDLTFEGLTGDVKVYVWDNNMVPLLDTALDA